MTTPIPAEVVKALDEWVEAGWSAESMAGDASVRAYYRVRRSDGTSAMLAWYPEEVRPQLARFLAAYRAISPAVALPAVLHHSDCAVLQDDAGDRTVFDVLFNDPAKGIALYGDAVDVLAGLQRASDPGVNAPFTAEFFAAELNMSVEYYASKLMGAPPEVTAALQEPFKKLCDSIAQHPYVLCHRDYHGQNVHVINDHLFVIDYQDARPGPDTYDLASLLRDRGVARVLGEEIEERYIQRYAVAARAPGDVRTRYFESLLQRSIKILGTFSKQPIARGRMHYLEFIPPTIESVERCLKELPQYSAISRWLPRTFDSNEAVRTATRLHAAQSG